MLKIELRVLVFQQLFEKERQVFLKSYFSLFFTHHTEKNETPHCFSFRLALVYTYNNSDLSSLKTHRTLNLRKKIEAVDESIPIAKTFQKMKS